VARGACECLEIVEEVMLIFYCCDYCENHSVQFEEGLDMLLSSSLFFNKGLLNL